MGNSVDIQKQVDNRNSPSDNLAGGGGSSFRKEFGSIDNSISKEDAVAVTLDGDNLSGGNMAGIP